MEADAAIIPRQAATIDQAASLTWEIIYHFLVRDVEEAPGGRTDRQRAISPP
jgi:hypothetical protein